ncbi:MAG TPA: COX15/CtaA family protein [Bryobacteraceae bacterium]|nr:COX15/CtaA family protein [Bryobacteraceae bacterium]
MENSEAHSHNIVRDSVWLHRYTLLLAVCTLFLVIAGAEVTSHQAGLSVPDWPLSYGQVMPPMTGGVRWEHGHRMVATSVGLLTIGLVIFLARREKRAWMRRLGWIALGAVIVQGVLGGLTVLLLLPPAVSVAHACLAQLFFSTTVAMAVFTSRSWQRGPEPVSDYGWPSMRTLAIVTPAAILAQIALGAGFRHRAITVLPHVIGAMVVAIVILTTCAFVLHQFPEHGALRKAAKALLSVTLVQLALGLATYFVGSRTEAPQLAIVVFTVLHVAAGALTLAASVVLSIQIRRNVLVPMRAGADSQHAAVIS